MGQLDAEACRCHTAILMRKNYAIIVRLSFCERIEPCMLMRLPSLPEG